MKAYIPTKCECEEPSPFKWILAGILVGQPQKKGYRYIERCDICERFCTDEVACEIYSKLMGGHVGHGRDGRVVYIPA